VYCSRFVNVGCVVYWHVFNKDEGCSSTVSMNIEKGIFYQRLAEALMVELLWETPLVHGQTPVQNDTFARFCHRKLHFVLRTLIYSQLRSAVAMVGRSHPSNEKEKGDWVRGRKAASFPNPQNRLI